MPVVWGLAFAPPDHQQGNSFRIFYIHLPSAILAQSVFVFMAVAGLVSLVWRVKLADIFIKVAAPFGAATTLFGVVKWCRLGKPTWGTWWIWDARLTFNPDPVFPVFGCYCHICRHGNS
ncbi:MAG: cytochrome c biogenesis protein CcsA [Porticoccaceae bacterium]